MSRVKLDFRAASVQGFGYASNDDRLLLLEDYGVCAVADGTGGYGEAATVMLDAIQHYIVAHGRPLNLRQLESAVRAGEDALTRAASSDDMIRWSGTTLDIAVFLDDRLLCIHVGDGRIYRLRDGTIEQLSTDHTWVQEQVDAGTLSPAEAVSHPLANVMMRALPAAHRVKLDTITLPLEAGDVIVLCTDGAWKPRGEQFVRLVAQGDEALDEILSERAARDGRPTRPSDNATAIVVRVDLVREGPSHFG